jgi:hypothetical protein
MKKGDLVRLVRRVPLPQFLDEDIGKVGLVTHELKGEWTIVLIDEKFQLHAIKNLEALDEEG